MNIYKCSDGWDKEDVRALDAKSAARQFYMGRVWNTEVCDLRAKEITVTHSDGTVEKFWCDMEVVVQ